MDKAIVFVDDEDIILDSLKEQVIRHFGHSFVYETATSAEEGLAVIEDLFEDQVPVIVVVTDWYMPGQKGDEMLAKLKSKHPDMASILLTGQASPQAIQRAKEEALVDKVINKPWDEQELIGALQSLM